MRSGVHHLWRESGCQKCQPLSSHQHRHQAGGPKQSCPSKYSSGFQQAPVRPLANLQMIGGGNRCHQCLENASGQHSVQQCRLWCTAAAHCRKLKPSAALACKGIVCQGAIPLRLFLGSLQDFRELRLLPAAAWRDGILACIH